MFARSIVPAVALGLLVAGPAQASPPTAAPTAAVSATAVEHPHDGGIIAGKITSVDYRRNVMIVNRTDIMLMPSTQIQGSDSGYHVITDLKRGMSVEVYTSQIAGKYTAQIITLR